MIKFLQINLRKRLPVDTSEGIETSTNEALARIKEWISEHGLELAHQKTEAVMLTRKWA